MKKRSTSARTPIPTAVTLGLILFTCFTAARAAVTPSVCFEPKPETFTRIINVGEVGTPVISVTQPLPLGFYRNIIINPGGANEEIVATATTSQTSSGLYLQLPRTATIAHESGEPVIVSTDGDAVFGYNNNSSTAVNIPRGVSSHNYFSPGLLVYPAQLNVFQPGWHENAFTVKAVSLRTFTWFLDGSEATFTGSTTQICGTITHQGRLSDGGNAANGQYDLQFQLYNTSTGGVAQGPVITLEDVLVTNGIFTVQLPVGTALVNNFTARYLEIGVRPGTASGTDPFTTLSPRQPITTVPYAINAQYAATAGTATNATNATTAANAAIAVNATNAANAVTATTAINSNQLGGIAASSYLTNTSLFGQSANTVNASGNIQVTSAMTAYTLVPGLTQTVNVPANSSVLISTEGGIQSTGTTGTFSVADVSIFIDGGEAVFRRIVIGNSAIPTMTENWAISLSRTLAAGSHTIEVKVRGNVGNSVPANLDQGAPLGGQLTVAVIRK